MTPPRASRWSLRWSFRRQIVVLTGGVTAVAMLLLTLLVQVVLAHITTNDVDGALEDRAEAVVTGTTASSAAGSLTVPDALLAPGVAVFDGSGTLVAGSIPPSVRASYDDLATAPTSVVKDLGRQDRVRAQPFATSDGTRGVVVVSERLGPYKEAESLALVVSLVTGALATAVVAGTAAWTVRRALRPVAEMAATASDWSEHELGRRFALGPPDDEIGALATTLDTLLDKVSAAIRSEQRLTAELAHELRTPLTSIQGTVDLVLLRDGATLSDDGRAGLREAAAASRRMAATITTLLDLARSNVTAEGAATCALPDVVREVVATTRSHTVRTSSDVGDLRLALPHSLAVRTVSPVVDNAVRFARSSVTLTSEVIGTSVELTVADDGPGVATELAEAVFEPGRTCTPSSGAGGAGLGLALSRRIARTAGGDVRVAAPTEPADAQPAGARFVVSLPLA